MRRIRPVLVAGLLLAAQVAAAAAGGPATAQSAGTPAATPQTRLLAVPLASAEQGKQLFVGKGCVVCHAVNGIGGKAAPPLDAARDSRYLDVLDFAARMWRGAPTMILLQEMELGYQIELTGEELAHLAAFAADAEVQSGFRESDIPEVIRDWMVDEVYQELDPDNMAR
jgi:cytochrome c